MESKIKKESTSNTPRRKWLSLIITLVLCLIGIAFAVVFPQLLISREVGEFYSAHIFQYVSSIPTMLTSLIYFSITEVLVVVGSIFLVVFLVYFIVRFILILRKEGFKAGMYAFVKFMRNVLVIALIGIMVFQLMHGLNYRRLSPIYKLQIGRTEHTYEEYCEALDWAYSGMVQSRRKLGSDYNGVAHFMGSFDTSVYEANGLLDAFSREYNLALSPNYVRAKPVMLSHLWRYTDIVGVYDMFLGEANVNTDYMDVVNTPMTICHEISHAKGYASETDCNVIASLACIHSNRVDFRYSGYCYIYFDIRSKVIDIARNCGYELPASVSYPQEVYRDYLAFYQYDDMFNQGLFAQTVDAVSESVNNAFLEANGQEGGTSTYKVPMDIYVDFYFMYLRQEA